MAAGLRAPSLQAWYACSITISTRTPRATRGSVRRTPIVVGCCAAALALGVLAFLAAGADRQAPVVRRAYVHSFDGRALTNPFEIMAVQSDGQAYVALARDPLLRRPEEFPTRAEAAYRAQRPLLPWLAWASALGRPGLVPATLAVWQVLAFGLAGWAVASLLASREGPAWAAAGMVLLPGAFESLSWLGPETLAVGLAAAGVLYLERERPSASAALLAAAALARETLLVVPAALLAASGRSGTRTGRTALLVPFGVAAAWVIAVRWRTGAWPLAAASSQRLDLPLRGLIAASTHWDDPVGAITFLGITGLVAAGALAIRHRRDPNLWLVVAGFVVLAAVMGEAVWARWEDFTRPLLALHVFGLVALMSPERRRDGREARR